MLSYTVGDETFLRILREFYDRYKYSTATFDDFIQVAQEISGQDLSRFVEQWVYTNKKLDYAVGSFSSRRAQQGEQESFVNRVVVHRLRKAVMPIEVEARLGNKETVTQRLDGEKESDTLVFSAPSRIRAVSVDPRHQLLDIDRYNNTKPVGLKFDLLNIFDFAFSNDERFHVMLLPSISRSEDHGWEYGIGLRGKGGFCEGPLISGRSCIAQHYITAGLTYTKQRRAFNAFLDYSTSLADTRRAAYVGGFSLENKNGKRVGEAYVKSIRRDDALVRWGVWKLSLEERQYYRLGYLSPDIWQTGGATFLSLSFAYSDFNREKGILKGLVAHVITDGSIKALGGEYHYRRITASAQVYRKRLLVWLSSGLIDGYPPFQEKYDLASQGNFRGLPLHRRVGKRLLAGGVEARIGTPFLLGVFPFLTAGGLPNQSGTYYESGIGLGIGLKKIEPGLQLRIDFPFWESDPLPEQREWDFRRFQIRLGVPFSPDQWYEKRKS
jgi:hypothetical protein